VPTLILTKMLVCVPARMLLDARTKRRRRDPDLTERLLPLQPPLADEANEWLQRDHDAEG
jgi:hypothetical protein